MHMQVYYFGLPDGWEPAQVGNDAALGLLERFVHDGIEADRCGRASTEPHLLRRAQACYAHRGRLPLGSCAFGSSRP